MIKNIAFKLKDSFYYKNLERLLEDCSTVLDVGCGSNSPIVNIRRHFYSEGIDIFPKSIKESKKNKIHDKYKIGDVLKLEDYYKKKSFDAVIALDLVEHMEKKDSLELIKAMERIAKKKVIILTPNGFYHQDQLDGNPYQTHKSKWELKDFKRLGYKVYGLRGLKFLRGEYASIKFRPWFLWGLIAFISEPILYFIPQLSYHLFAVKKI